MDLEKIKKKYKSKIEKISNKYGVYNLRVFGSYSKGKQNKNSDLDILYSANENFSLLKHSALEIELKNLLKLNVQLVSDKVLSPLIKKEVLKTAIKI